MSSTSTVAETPTIADRQPPTAVATRFTLPQLSEMPSTYVVVETQLTLQEQIAGAIANHPELIELMEQVETETQRILNEHLEVDNLNEQVTDVDLLEVDVEVDV